MVWFGKFTDIASLVSLFGFTTPASLYIRTLVAMVGREDDVGVVGDLLFFKQIKHLSNNVVDRHDGPPPDHDQ